MMKNIAFFTLAIWLIAQGVLTLSQFHFPYQKLILPALALVAGAVLLIEVLKTRIASLGLLFLSLWLILMASMPLFHYSFPYSSMVSPVLAIIAGVFLLIRK